ncbi:glutathione peroxidase 7-like isoform X2 [Macrobrachium nipponense]|uniref:glutathione peroxidase 7-like isoform X2 n=1 Tax=Macrobrachium nipponense TaxID=159736 RepID=UPI0030C88493
MTMDRLRLFTLVTLVVNVASHCGYTEATYRALKKLHDILSYGDHFSVLAFPCNQFGEQEPLDMPEIINFVTSEYNVEFPIFNKINVIGEDAEPAFRQLTDESSVVPDWNFYKYLVDETGHVIDAWGTATTIESIFDEINFAVEKAKEKSKSTPPATEKKQKPASEAEKNKDEL